MLPPVDFTATTVPGKSSKPNPKLSPVVEAASDVKVGPVVLSSWQSFWVISRIRWHLLRLIYKQIRNPAQAISVMRELIKTRRRYLGDAAFRKASKVDGRYYYEYNTPGWPSKAFDEYHLAELNRIMPFQNKRFAFKNVIVAITKKCALNCAHCFEWEALNGKETLTVPHLQAIVRQFQTLGVGQLQFSGGEPLLRMPALLSLLEQKQPGTDFWVLTSGHLLTLENAHALKAAGLTGVTISLDHFDPVLHNQFRGFDQAYDWVEKAAANARVAGLVIAFSLCATKAFVTEENLMTYARLVAGMGASFIQVLEPRPVGHFKGQAVGLPEEQRKLLENFYTNLNYNPAFHHLPMVTYYDLQRRRAGCAAAADRHVYVDTDGLLHACPFCQKPVGSAADENIELLLTNLREAGCPVQYTLPEALTSCQTL